MKREAGSLFYLTMSALLLFPWSIVVAGVIRMILKKKQVQAETESISEEDD